MPLSVAITIALLLALAIVHLWRAFWHVGKLLGQTLAALLLW